MRTVYKLSGECSITQKERRDPLLSQDAGLAELAHLVEQTPANLDARLRLAAAYLDHQLYCDSYELLTSTPEPIPAGSESEMNLHLARLWDAWGDYELALNYGERATALGASSAEAYQLVGRIHLHRKDPAQAVGWFKRAAETEGSATQLANLGYSYVLISDWANAKTVLEQSIELDNSIAEAHNNLAIVLLKLGNEEDALRQLLKTAEPHVAFNNMGVLYLLDNNTERARESFKKSLELEPQYEVAQRNLQIVHAPTETSTVELPPFSQLIPSVVGSTEK